MNNKNIYIKLQEMRKEFHSKELKKSGVNKFAGYSYFELKDIIPVATVLLEKYHLTTIMNCGIEESTLTLINSDNPAEQIVFNMLGGSCSLKGTQDIQNNLAVVSFQKRYLYLNLLDVVESDGIEAATGKEDAKEQVPATTRKLSEAQINRMYLLAKKAGYNKEDVKKHIKNKYNKEDEYTLTKSEYDRACEGYESKINN